MKFYLSYGAGVGSEALRLWLIENNWPHEAVYVDHGCDWPETREFVKTVPNLTVIKPDVEGFDNLYNYCLHYKMVPSFKQRYCSDKFKVRVLLKYFKRPCVTYLGFTIEETHRMKNSKDDDHFKQYPLISMGMTRRDCEAYIRSKGVPVPMRSGCWFCPSQRKGQWKLLRRRHPDLYKKAKELERVSTNRRKEQGKDPLTISRSMMKLEDITQERQGELF